MSISMDAQRYKRPRFARTLNDITNHRDPPVQNSKTQLLTKTTVDAIAQRNRLKNEAIRTSRTIELNIDDIDRKLTKLVNRQIPDIVYNISKRKTMFNRTNKQTTDLKSELDSSEGNIEALEKHFQIECETLKSQHTATLSTLDENFAEDTQTLLAEKEKEVDDLEKIRPKDELLKEIEVFSQEMEFLNNKLKELETSNEIIVTKYDEQLDKEFEVRRQEKLKLSTSLQNECQQKFNEKHRLINELEKTEFSINTLMEESLELEEKIAMLQANINNVEKSSVLPEQKDKDLSNRLHEIKQEYEIVKEMKNLEDENLAVHYIRLAEETHGRRLLQNTIDELKGHVRSFAYKNTEKQDPTKEELLVFDYENTNVSDFASEENKMFNFNKVFSSEQYNLYDLLKTELNVYNNMCLKNHENFNLFSISSKPIHAFQETFLKYVSHTYLDKYDIKFQNLSLYDGKYDNDSPFKLLEDNSMTLDRTPISLTGYSYSIDEQKALDITHIKVLKLQFEPKALYTEEKLVPIEFYLIQVDNIKTLNLLEDFLKKNKQWNQSQTGLFILKLLNYTKSCFLFNFDSSEDITINRTILDISETVGKIRNPPKKNDT